MPDLVPLETVPRMHYTCPLLRKNGTRNKILFEAKKRHKIKWSAQFLRFEWQVAF